MIGVSLLLIFILACLVVLLPLRNLRRIAFIRSFELPTGLLKKLADRHPGFSSEACALVWHSLQHFFLIYLRSGKQSLSMPSVVADELWHEFILDAREYERFCRRAFGGYLHHSPAVSPSLNHESNEGLRRVWRYACADESINPVYPPRLPLLFALDEKLKVPGGFVYPVGSEQLRDLTDSARTATGLFPGWGVSV